MNFTSPLFFIFLLLVVAVNYALPLRFRACFLVAASLFFIGYHNAESLIALLFFALFNFYAAKNVNGKRFLYCTAVFVNVLAIVLFNYFAETVLGFRFAISSLSFHIENFIIALGLSFYSLQNISYLTEVYYKRMLPETDISAYVLYTAFFPKIISGPVMMPKEFFPQIKNTSITQENVISGFNRVLIGLMKKMVIADRLSPAVSSVFDHHNNYNGITILIASYLFTIQLYFDFSGYTDMALGAAKMLGYDLKENFNLPFRASTVSDFWRRWHVSLISWFTFYIYYPIAFRLRDHKKIAAVAGLVLTFFASVIWHGIGFTFFAWAACHAIYLSFEVFTGKYRQRVSEKLNGMLYKLCGIFIVFNAVCFSNIFFRADSITNALHLAKNEFSAFIPQNWLTGFVAPLAVGGHQLDMFNFFTSILLVIIFLLFERKINRLSINKNFSVLYVVVCLLVIMLFGVFDSGSRFIYMQF